jgi:hypothetical protein
MPVEVNVKSLFQDFNPSKFVVYGCLLIFILLFALRLDGIIMWNYWIIFLPLWIWKVLVVVGSIVGSWVWWRHPHYRMEGDSYTQYKAMIIATGLHLLLLMFELLACDKLNTNRPQMLWVLVFIPLFCIAVAAIGLCVWALKHGRTFEMELFFSVNILQFIFIALRLDEFIRWRWVIVFIPIWIVMCVALVGVVYAIILAIILLRSSDIIPEQRRGSACSAIGYTCMVLPLLVFEILFVNKEDGVQDLLFITVAVPLLVALLALMLMSFGARTGNQWWFGIRKEFCPWLLDICPLLQEYGNISYKVRDSSADNSHNVRHISTSDTDPATTQPSAAGAAVNPRDSASRDRPAHKRPGGTARSKQRGGSAALYDDAASKFVMPIVSIEMPD